MLPRRVRQLRSDPSDFSGARGLPETSGGPCRSSLRSRVSTYAERETEGKTVRNYPLALVATLATMGRSQGSANRDFYEILRQPKGRANMASPMTGEDPKALPRFRVFRFESLEQRTSREDRDCVGFLFGAARGRKTPRRCEKESDEGRFYFRPSGFPFLSTACFPLVSTGRGTRGWVFFLTFRFPFTVLLAAVLVLSSCDSAKGKKDPRNFGPRKKGKCTGSDPCLTCTTCSSCKYCRDSKKCGVCR